MLKGGGEVGRLNCAARAATDLLTSVLDVVGLAVTGVGGNGRLSDGPGPFGESGVGVGLLGRACMIRADTAGSDLPMGNTGMLCTEPVLVATARFDGDVEAPNLRGSISVAFSVCTST